MANVRWWVQEDDIPEPRVISEREFRMYMQKNTTLIEAVPDAIDKIVTTMKQYCDFSKKSETMYIGREAFWCEVAEPFRFVCAICLGYNISCNGQSLAKKYFRCNDCGTKFKIHITWED